MAQISASDSDRRVPAELGQESQASSCLRKGTPLASRGVLSRSGGEKGLRGSGAGTLGVPLGGTRRGDLELFCGMLLIKRKAEPFLDHILRELCSVLDEVPKVENQSPATAGRP